MILLTCVTEYVCNQLLQKFYARYYDKLSILEMRFDYFFRLSNNPKASKDIRLYNAKDWLFSILDKNISVQLNNYLLGKVRLIGVFLRCLC